MDLTVQLHPCGYVIVYVFGLYCWESLCPAVIGVVYPPPTVFAHLGNLFPV